MTTLITILPTVHAMWHIIHTTLHLHYVHTFNTTLQYYTSVPSVGPESVDFRLCQVRTVYDAMLGYGTFGLRQLRSVTYGYFRTGYLAIT